MKVTAIITLVLGIVTVGLLGCRTHAPISLADFETSQTTSTTLTSHTVQVSNPSAGLNPDDPPAPKRALVTLGQNEELSKLVREAHGVVLIDFYADWCGPCKKQGSILKDLENTAAANKASIIKVNVDNHRELAKKFKVAALPTILVLKEGKIVDRHLGLTSRTKIASLLTK